MNKKQFIVHHS